MADTMDPVLMEIFVAAYRYRRKYQHPTRSEQFWSNAAREHDLTIERCGSHPFAQALLMACYQDIQRELLEAPPSPDTTQMTM